MGATLVEFTTPEAVDRARAALVADAALLIPGACQAEYCADVVKWIDADETSSAREQYYRGTELRIWDREEHHAMLNPFRKEADSFIAGLTQAPNRAFSILAIRNNQIPPNDPSIELGRWHIDSFRKQLKVFLFLTDTTVESGAFEYVPGTQAPRFKMAMALKGIYFKPGDFFRGRQRSYTKLPDTIIDRLANRGYRVKPVLVKAGTAMIVDTSAIHRARPCRAGSRYALTAYYR